MATESSDVNIKNKARGIYHLGDRVLSIFTIDGRSLMGLMMIVLAMAILGAPDVGAASSLAGAGVSPKGFAYVCGVLGALILRDPHTKFFTLMLMPLAIYVAAFLHYATIHPEAASGAPLAWYITLLIFALKAGREG